MFSVWFGWACVVKLEVLDEGKLLENTEATCLYEVPEFFVNLYTTHWVERWLPIYRVYILEWYTDRLIT